MLVEAGLSARETEVRLASVGRAIHQIDAVVVSHEHQDHVRGLQTLTALKRLTVVATPGTLKRIRKSLAPGTDLVAVSRGSEVRLGDLTVTAFGIPHDAAEPAGFRLSSGGARLGYVTDLGSAPASVAEALGGVTALILESNHDLELLRNGPYPARLKKRILSPYGHLSNEATGELLRECDLGSLALLYLAHLSRTNNSPALALAVAGLALAERGLGSALKVSRHDRASPSPRAP